MLPHLIHVSFSGIAYPSIRHDDNVEYAWSLKCWRCGGQAPRCGPWAGRKNEFLTLFSIT